MSAPGTGRTLAGPASSAFIALLALVTLPLAFHVPWFALSFLVVGAGWALVVLAQAFRIRHRIAVAIGGASSVVILGAVVALVAVGMTA